MRSTSKATVDRARRLRREMSPPEAALWTLLRKRPDGFKFRRQHPIGPFVLDFYCPAARLGIEIDGVAHEMGNNPERDERKDRWMNEHRVRMLRINSEEVSRNVEGAVRQILVTCTDGPSTTLRVVPLPMDCAHRED